MQELNKHQAGPRTQTIIIARLRTELTVTHNNQTLKGILERL